MAYKSKSYRKFLATGTTAALVASAIAPAASAADHPFTDVNKNYDEAVSYLYSNNITKGYTETTFGTYMSLTRGNAAVIIANALNLDTTSAADAGFEDVNSRVAGSVNALVEAGIMDGFSDTEFRPDVELSRGAMAKILVNAYGLEGQAMDTPFTDLTSTFGSYIEALYGAGITTGKTETTFGTNQEILRGEFAVLLYKSINFEDVTPEVSSVMSSSSTEFTVNFEEAVEEGVKVEDLNLDVTVVLDNGTEVTPEVTGAKLSADRKSVTVMHENNDLDGLKGSIMVNGVDGAFDYTDAKVTSVTAMNAKQVVVKFNTELTSDNNVSSDASEVALYTLDGVAPTSAVLSEDKKTVTLSFAGTVEGTDQVLVVNPVATSKKDKDGQVVKTDKYSKVLSYTDTVKPEVVGTSYENGKIVVSYSEEIGVKPSVVRVNGNPVSSSDIAINSSDKTKVEISYSLGASTTASLYVAGAKDTSAAMNEMNLFNGTVVTSAADTAKPQITGVQVTGQNTAKVTLSEAVNENTILATLQKGATQTSVNLVKDTTDTTGKTFKLTVDLNGNASGDGIFSGNSNSETFTLFVAAGAMTDKSTPANSNELFSTNLTFVKDETAPVLTASQVSTDSKKLEFKFSEDLTVAGSDANIIIKNGDGVKINAIDSETSLKLNDAKTYQVDTKTGNVALDAGNYTVTIPAGFFTDAYGNKTVAVTSTFTVGAPTSTDTTKPTAAVSNVTNMKNVFEIAYSEEVTSTALNVSNYKLDGQSLSAGTEIYFTDTDKDTVRIVLPSNSIDIGDQTNGTSAILTVSGVADKAGNVINTSNTSVVVKDNTAASITDVQVLGTDVYVTFNENISVPSTTDALEAFKVTVGGTDLTANDVSDLTAVSGNMKQVKFTLASTDRKSVV